MRLKLEFVQKKAKFEKNHLPFISILILLHLSFSFLDENWTPS